MLGPMWDRNSRSKVAEASRTASAEPWRARSCAPTSRNKGLRAFRVRGRELVEAVGGTSGRGRELVEAVGGTSGTLKTVSFETAVVARAFPRDFGVRVAGMMDESRGMRR